MASACFRTKAICASENFDAYIGFSISGRGIRTGKSQPKTVRLAEDVSGGTSPDTNYPPVEDQAHDRLVRQRAGIPGIPIGLRNNNASPFSPQRWMVIGRPPLEPRHPKSV